MTPTVFGMLVYVHVGSTLKVFVSSSVLDKDKHSGFMKH